MGIGSSSQTNQIESHKPKVSLQQFHSQQSLLNAFMKPEQAFLDAQVSLALELASALNLMPSVSTRVPSEKQVEATKKVPEVLGNASAARTMRQLHKKWTMQGLRALGAPKVWFENISYSQTHTLALLDIFEGVANSL